MFIVNALNAIMDLIGKTITFFKKYPWLAITTTVAALSFVAGFYVGNYSPARNHDLHGLDLATYCHSYGYETNTDSLCIYNIKFKEACNWQYGRSDLTFHFLSSSSPYTAQCYSPQGRDLGGIDDMAGYCKHRFRVSVDVEPQPVGPNDWQCRMPISKKLACAWRYQKYQVEARKHDGVWKCYD